MTKNTDPFTIEIIQNSLLAITDEMFVSYGKTAVSSTIFEALDCGVAILDADSRLTTSGKGAPLFIGMMDGGVKSVIQKFGREYIHDGDVFIANDVSTLGHNHLNDVSIMVPVFAEGELLAWTANKGHWSDIGGIVPGSLSYTSTEIYQEGLQLPNVKLIDRGHTNQDVIDIVRANTRLPDTSTGDMWAGVAAARVGQRRLIEIAEKYGADTVQLAIDRLLDYGESISRRAIAELPNGTYEIEDCFDDEEPVKMKMTITDEEIIVDLRENTAPSKENLNCPYDGTVAGIKISYVALTCPQGPVNEGTFRPLKVLCTPGSRFAAERPMAVGFYFEPSMQATDLFWHIVTPLAQDRMTAGHVHSVCALLYQCTHPDTGENVIQVEPNIGGWGAGIGKDGENGQFCCFDGDTFTMPVEMLDERTGCLVEQYSFHNEDGGEGEFRGGKGVYLDYRVLAEDLRLATIFTRHKSGPWGMNGGRDGSLNYVEIHRNDGSVERHANVSEMPLAKGELIRVVSANGGGCGDPKNRPRDKIVEDIKNRFITPKQARVHYGFCKDFSQ